VPGAPARPARWRPGVNHADSAETNSAKKVSIDVKKKKKLGSKKKKPKEETRSRFPTTGPTAKVGKRNLNVGGEEMISLEIGTTPRSVGTPQLKKHSVQKSTSGNLQKRNKIEKKGAAGGKGSTGVAAEEEVHSPQTSEDGGNLA